MAEKAHAMILVHAYKLLLFLRKRFQSLKLTKQLAFLSQVYLLDTGHNIHLPPVSTAAACGYRNTTITS
jgi:hypothetical protein